MLDALYSLLRGAGSVLAIYSMGRLLGDTVARVVDDFTRNRATRRRLREAGFKDPEHAPRAPGRMITRMD